MNKVILIPDSFKGSLTSLKAVSIMEQVIRRHDPECFIHSIPISDGGEGFLDCLLRIFPGERIPLTVRGPRGNKIPSAFGLLPNKTAVIELALASGLMLAGMDNDPGRSTTFGVGELIRSAIALGVKELWIGLGGSATNDGGCGLAEALGMVFYDKDGLPIHPSGSTLSHIKSLSLDRVPKECFAVSFTLFTDVTNPLCGPDGAANVYAGQKGANPDQITILEANMQAFAGLLQREYGFNPDAPGTGAAGGAGMLLQCFFNAKVTQGIEAMLDLVNFDQILPGTDWVLTGEGRLDRQTVTGKAIGGIARRCHEHQIPLVAFVGRADLERHELPCGVTKVIEITPRNIDLIPAMNQADRYLRQAVKSWIDSH